MAKLVFGLNQSLDGYIDHTAFSPGPKLFRYFVEHARSLSGSIYGRRMYETMNYWDTDSQEWSPDECDFAAARPPLRLVASDMLDENVIRLTYVPA